MRKTNLIIIVMILLVSSMAFGVACPVQEELYNFTSLQDESAGFNIKPARLRSGGNFSVNGTGQRQIERITWRIDSDCTGGNFNVNLYNATQGISKPNSTIGRFDTRPVTDFIAKDNYEFNFSSPITVTAQIQELFIIGNASGLTGCTEGVFVYGSASEPAENTFYDTSADGNWITDGNFNPQFIVYGCDVPTAGPNTPDPPSIQSPSPADNSNNNTNVTLNVSHSTLQNDVNYYLYFGNTDPLTENDLYVNNETRTGNEYKSFLTNVSDGVYFWKWKVQNTTNGEFSLNTTQRTLTIDTVSPTISLGLNGNNNFSTDNSTIISNYLRNLSIDITFFDTNLAGGQTLVNITNESDASVFQLLNTSITGTTVNISQVIDISTLSLGNYTIKLEATDSHTDSQIPEYDKSSGLDYFRYITPEGNTIKIISDTLPLTKDSTKYEDRYDFEFNYLFQKDTYKFRIESENKIKYLQNSKVTVGPHFVIIGDNGNGNWLDFENSNLQSKDYVITKIDDYTYEIEVTANGMKSFKFNSIGGLNKVVANYKLQIGATLEIWVFDEDNHPQQINATATIGTQSSNTTTNISGAQLENITKDITSLSLFSTNFGTEQKSIVVTQSFHNLSFNMTVVNAAKLFFFDERSETLIQGETFSAFLEATGFAQTFGTITDNPHTIIGLANGLYRIKASSSNYPEREYRNINISNTTTTNLNLYLINDTLGSTKTFNIVDQGLNPLSGVTVVFTKTINNTGTIVAQEVSDFAGQVILTLDDDSEYTINFSKNDFEDRTIKLEPKNSEYVIQMISSIGKYNQSVYEGIRHRFEPSDTVLNNNTNFNFSFTLNSSVWTLTNCTLRLKNGTKLLNESSGFTSNSCRVEIQLNTANMSNITSEAIYELDSQFEFTVTQQYQVVFTYEGQFSLKNFLDDVSDFGMAGFDDFGRMILAIIIIFIITALATREIVGFTSFTNPEVLIFIVIAQVWFFSAVGWFFLDFAPIPIIAGFNLKKYIIAILVTLAGGAFIIEKFSK